MSIIIGLSSNPGALILPMFLHKVAKGSLATIFGEKSGKNEEKLFFWRFRIKAIELHQN